MNCRVAKGRLNIIAGISTFEGNPHDSTTLEPCLLKAEAMTSKSFARVVVDRGYRGKKKVLDTEVILPKGKEDQKLSPKEREQKRKLCRQRAAIEPIISHVKHDCRMAKNYLKGVKGDIINAVLAATAFNLRQWIARYRKKILSWLLDLFLLLTYKPINTMLLFYRLLKLTS